MWVLAEGAGRGTSVQFEYVNVNPTNNRNENENPVHGKEKDSVSIEVKNVYKKERILQTLYGVERVHRSLGSHGRALRVRI